jgi:predicted  nucleic acid-binding Zn-ribbon protein
MSPIGRIFIVLNLILAAVFLAWAGNNVATSAQYKQKYEDEQDAHEATKQELETQVSDLRVRLDTKSTEADTARSERDDAARDRDRLTQENQDLARQISEANATNDKNAAAISDIQATLAAIETAKDEAVARAREAENARDDALASAQDANTRSEDLAAQNAALENQISDLNTTIAGLQRDVSSLDTQLATLVDVTGVTVSEIMGQELINASVLQAVYDIKPGLVALNVGSNSGVKRGYTFEVYNGAQYKGQVRVENVREDMCTALILRTEEGQTIQSGDKAATRL